MLPPDSMRFFYLDPGWLECLLQGACSVGKIGSRDELADKNLRDNFLRLAFDEAPNVRTWPAAQAADSAAPVDWPLTGFLLRSPVVAGWQGLEMQAWADSGENPAFPLTPLRIDRLAPDIMLCIFNGTVRRIEVKQPPEGMHFGASKDGAVFTRHLTCGSSTRTGPGNQLDEHGNAD